MNKRIATFKLLPVLLLLPLLAAGCDKADNPIAPSGSTVSISANPSRITLTGQSTLTITGFRPDGNRLNPGTQITLSSSLGTLSSNIVAIGADGFASATLKADGREGDATVTAKLTTAASGDSGAEVTINVGTSKPSILIVAERSEIDPAEGIFVTFFARDENQLPLGAGEVIQVAASLGTMTVNNTEVTSLVTDSSGRAVGRFFAGAQAGTAKISAFLRNSDVATADIIIRDKASSFEITLDKTNVSNGEQIRVTVIVSNAAGRPAQGILVLFGVTVASGTFNPSSQTTGTEGQAVSTFTFNQGTLPGGTVFTITATVVINGQSVTKSKPVTVQGGTT